MDKETLPGPSPTSKTLHRFFTFLWTRMAGQRRPSRLWRPHIDPISGFDAARRSPESLLLFLRAPYKQRLLSEEEIDPTGRSLSVLERAAASIFSAVLEDQLNLDAVEFSVDPLGRQGCLESQR